MKTHALFYFATILGGVLLVGSATADVVTLEDGSRVVGSVTRWSEGKLTLETKFAGTLEIDTTQVKSVETEEKVNIQMNTGDRLVGKINWQPAIEKGVVQTDLGGVPFAIGHIEDIWPEGAKSPDEIKLDLKLAEAEKEYQAKLPKWTFTLEAGLVAKEGNTETLNARGRMDLKRKTDKDLLSFFLSGDYEEDDNVRSTAEAKGGAAYEYMITKRLFAYARSELEYDEFENLDLRLTVTAGAGYYWLKEEAYEYKTRIGAGYRHESYRDGSTANEPILDLGHDFRYDIAPWLQFVHALTYTPSLEELRDYRLVADQGILIPLGDSEKWKLKLGALYEYDAMPQPGVERLDQTYYANLVFNIKP